MAPDTKLCFSGTITTGRPGRCPLDFEVVAGTGSNFLLQQQRCLFDSDCLYYSQKCCYNRAIGVPTCTVATSIPNDPVVTTLISGSADLVPNGISFPATISLVQSRGKNILFETGTPAQRSDIISALRNTSGLTLADIHYVINSHGHPDHLANNGMFPDTPILNNMLEITGSFVKTNGLGQARPARSFVLDDPRIEAIRTPGHTLTDISMIVSNVTNLGTVALVGDLIVSETDAASNQDWQSTSQNVEAQTANRRYVLCLADWIVPGHGRLFRVTPNMRTVNGGCVGAAQRIT